LRRIRITLEKKFSLNKDLQDNYLLKLWRAIMILVIATPHNLQKIILKMRIITKRTDTPNT
jgi:hypothetical protein